MPRRRDEKARVLGPTWIPSRGQWRITKVDPRADGGGGRRNCRYFASEKEATEFRALIEPRLVRLQRRTVADALDAHEQYLLEQGNNLPESYGERMRRLRLFFAPMADLQLSRLQPEQARKLYEAFRFGRSVDYHRNTLGNARGFLKWCKSQGWISENPLEGVEGVGRRVTGKSQLTGDEARKLYGWCMWKAHRRGTESERRDSDAAIGALMLLLMGLRQGDVIRRLVRDVDLDATVLHVSQGKTQKSNRARQIPDVLRPLLRTAVAGRSPMEPLFPIDGNHHTKAWLHAAVRRFCRDADVPRVCPHSLKGTAGSVLADTGEASNKIADHLSHESEDTTRRHYVRPGAMEDARRERGIDVITKDQGLISGAVSGAEVPSEEERLPN